MLNERLASRHIVLLGVGHTNAHVLRMWRMNPIPDTDLTCVTDFPVATYSGMLPAVLAGQIPKSRMEIDLVRLCAANGARLIGDRVSGIDHRTRELLFDERPPIPFDVLSIGVGSIASTDGVSIETPTLLPIKPMQTFLQRLTHALSRLDDRHRDRPLNVAVVGSGVAGIEITACLPPFLDKQAIEDYSLTIVTRSPQILPEATRRTRQLVADELASRSVAMVTGVEVQRVTPSAICLNDGTEIPADLVLWATGAVPSPFLADLDVEKDARGFIATDATLQSVSNHGVFAVGDTGTIVSESLPKAGVYAVRQGPILWQNIHRYLAGQSLRPYKPQRTFLKLINLGDGRAVAQWRGTATVGRTQMQWKDWIDQRFMDKFEAKPMADGDEDAMQCRGCGCKVGPKVLASALVPLNEGELDDAAVIGGDSASPLVASTDFFSSPFVDAYLTGRVAALHCASDVIATGGSPKEALANIVLPEGDAETQRRTLSDLLAGARREFAAMGTTIVGGHTIVGPRMEIGFTVIGRAAGKLLVKKSNLRPGDRLYLTKPLGIGILLAGHMRTLCQAGDYMKLIDAMLQPQHRFAELLADLGIDAGTDVTGFGLAGHLLEMLRASDVTASIELDRLPVLDGVEELIEQGVASSLAPDNRMVLAQMSIDSELIADPRLEILYDPQTCGGLLVGVDDETSARWVDSTEAMGLPTPTRIGRVNERDAQSSPLTIINCERTQHQRDAPATEESRLR